MKIQRSNFIKSLLGFSVFSPIVASATPKSSLCLEASKIRSGIIEALNKSKIMTLGIVEQMPDDFFGFKYTPEAMSFGEQFRHCAVYSFGQFAGRIGVKNPFEGKKPKVDLSKQEVIDITNLMYNTLSTWASEISEEKLMSDMGFSSENIPTWRFFYVIENHIIHHRGQAVVYLRLKGIKPNGYYGW